MARNLTGPVEIQSPVVLPEPFLSADSSHRPIGRRRIFVQTANGNVVGVEVHRADKANKVKKAVQSALRVPTEQYNLVFGGHILKDFSEVRNDVPVLLQKGMSRSSSSPCLSPVNVSFSIQKEKCVEAVGGSSMSFRVRSLIQESNVAVTKGVIPEPASGGLGGAYYFKNSRGEKIAIVKPTDEEPFAPNNPNGYVGRSLGQPGLKRNIRVGEAGMREVAAYLLDHKRFANVPHTALVKVTNPILNVNDAMSGSRDTVPTKLASFQKFVKHDYDASEHGTSSFPVKAVHRIGILDIRIFNLDRHSGNILVRELLSDEVGMWTSSSSRGEAAVELIPIDHGFSLPESLESAYFEWQHWPQASLPFSDEELEYIEALDPSRDSEMLRAELPILREASLRVLVVSTTLLKMGAKAGLTLAEIAAMMCSELRGTGEEASELERLCQLAQEKLAGEVLALSFSDKIMKSDDIGSHGFAEFDDDFEQFDLDLDKENSSESEFGSGREFSFSEGPDLLGPKAMVEKTGFGQHEAMVSSKGLFSPTPIMSVFSPPSAKESFDSIGEDAVEDMVQFSSVKPSKKFPLLSSKSLCSTSARRGCRGSQSPTITSPAKLYPKESSAGSMGYSEKSASDRSCPALVELEAAFPPEGSIDFSQLGESTWRSYLRVLEEVLQASLDLKREVNGVFMKRFGSSCKF